MHDILVGGMAPEGERGRKVASPFVIMTMTMALMLVPILVTAAIAVLAHRAWHGSRIERDVEARLPRGDDGIVRGGHPIASDGAGRGHAVLLLHGFGDTPQTLRYLADHLWAHGYAVHAPLLPGHGRTLRAFGASRATDWLGAARQALGELRGRYERVGVVGLSMGGALAVLLAAEPGELLALVLIAPYLDAPPAVRWIARWHRVLGACTPYVRGRGERSIHDPVERGRALSYGAAPPHLLRELTCIADRARTALGRVTAPTLLLQSRDDNRVAPAVAERALATLGADTKRLVWLEGCGHVVTVDHGREQVFVLVHEWLDTWVKGEAAGGPKKIE